MSDAADKELDAIKRLLILLLVKLGATSQEIAAAIKVHHSRVRQLVPTSKVKRIEFTKKVDGS